MDVVEQKSIKLSNQLYRALILIISNKRDDHDWSVGNKEEFILIATENKNVLMDEIYNYLFKDDEFSLSTKEEALIQSIKNLVLEEDFWKKKKKISSWNKRYYRILETYKSNYDKNIRKINENKNPWSKESNDSLKKDEKRYLEKKFCSIKIDITQEEYEEFVKNSLKWVFAYADSDLSYMNKKKEKMSDETNAKQKQDEAVIIQKSHINSTKIKSKI